MEISQQLYYLIRYDSDIGSNYDKYAADTNYLENKEFNCNKLSGGMYLCTNGKLDDRFIYVWQENDERSFCYGVVVK
jgi:hypothetical protein